MTWRYDVLFRSVLFLFYHSRVTLCDILWLSDATKTCFQILSKVSRFSMHLFLSILSLKNLHYLKVVLYLWLIISFKCNLACLLFQHLYFLYAGQSINFMTLPIRLIMDFEVYNIGNKITISDNKSFHCSRAVSILI